MADRSPMRSPSTEGLLLVDKPAGMTSHDVVAIARRSLGERQIGHAGTLDPFATGLLVLLVGRATRLLPYLDGEPKVYHAEVRFGTETDTDDATGDITREAPLPDASAVARAIEQLTGPLEQQPPAYSAKQVGGQRAHSAARAGTPLTLPTARVHVHGWRVVRSDSERLEAEITCSGGTYIRALARDLGRLTGSAAHLARLRRTQSGPCHVRDACTLERVQSRDCMPVSPLPVLSSLTPVQLADDELVRVVQGNVVPATVEGTRAALLAPNGDLVAVAERRGNVWQPRTVLRHD